MPHASRIIEEIKHLLYAGGNSLPEEVASLAADYMDLCATANERLRTCAGLLKRGLRSEAIQLADQQPNLVDLVATLDFAERAQWCAYLRQAGEMLPQDLLVDEGGELNDAYAMERPLTNLLQQHRSLALARAPLVERIVTLRKIAQVDALNSVWQDDLVTFETVRHRQIEAEVNAAATNGDIDTVARLQAEVCATGWRTPPPSTLKALVQAKHSRLRQESARMDLRRLTSQLSDAHAALDVDAARELRARWQACAEFTGLATSDPLADLAAPALAWLDEEDGRDTARGQFDADVLELDQKLDAGAPRDKLERAYYRAARHDVELPTTTEQHYRQRIAALDTAAGRRTKLILVAVVSVLIVLGAATTVAVRRTMFAGAVAEAAGRLKALLDQQNLDGAREYLDDLEKSRPDVAGAGAVREQAAQHHKLAATEAALRSQFDLALEAAKTSANFASPTPSTLANAEKKLNSEVSPLAQRPEEKTRIVELQKQIAAARSVVQQRMDDDFDRQLGELGKRYAQLTPAHFSPADSYDEALVDLRKRLVSLAGQASMATPPRGTSRAELADRVEASIRAAASRKDRRQWQQMVTAEVGNAARYTTILGEYAKKFADADRAKHFQQVVKEEDFWDGLRRWDEASQRLNPQNAAQFLNLAKSLLEDPVILKFPTLTPIRERLPYFEAVAKRPSDRREPESIKTLLENPLITGLNTIDVRRNVVQRYYVHREPVRPTKGRVDFHYVKNFQLEEEHFKGGLNTYLIDEDQIVLRDGDLTAKSPQWALADKLREAVERWPKDGWEAAFCSALEKAVADPELDPILKVLLLKNFIEAGKEGSLVFEEATRPVLGMLNRSDFDPNANWLLPDNDASNQQREIAKKIVAGLPPIAGTRNEMNKKLAWLAGFSFSQHAWIGWLAKEDGEDTNQPAWRCLMPKRVRETGDLVVIFQPAGEIIRLETIGRLSNQEPIVMAETSPALVEGRPVFLVLEGK